jgi:hypothetical protein
MANIAGMLHDRHDQKVSTDSPAAIAAIDRFAHAFVSHGKDALAIFDAVAADPACVLARTHAAALNLFAQTGDAPDLARPHLGAARESAGRATERELLYLTAVEAWAEGRLDRAIALHFDLAAMAPGDLVANKIGQIHCFSLGDNQGLLRFGRLMADARPDDPYAQGMLAFGLEQCHRLDEAETVARRASARAEALGESEPWAHHAVAHVLETQGRVAEGIAWMERNAPSWDGCNSFMYTHNWWHLALFCIDDDRPEHALALYDRRVWGQIKEYAQDQINAISLLIRLELRGVDVDDRWSDVGRFMKSRVREHVQPFLDLHFIYALTRSGQDELASQMLESMTNHAARVPDYHRETWAEATLPAARGLVAHARGRFAEAASHLATARDRLYLVGGSHAQRDLFEQVHLDALVRSGGRDAARAIVDERLAGRPGIAALRRLRDQLAA